MKISLPKVLKYIGYTLLTLIGILTILVLSLRLPGVQNFVKDKMVVYLEKKIQTKVQLDRVFIGFPNSIILENLYLQGQDIDTLLYVKKFDVGLDLPNLLKNKADITSIDLEGTKANIVRRKDGSFNFDYILNAFATTEKEQESTSKPFIISLDKIDLKDIGVSFIDQQSGNNINAYFKSFNTKVKTFDLQKNSYAINDISLDGLNLKLKQDLLEEVAQNVEAKVDSLNQKSPMAIDLNGIKLTNINIDYGDDNTKTFAKVQFRELKTNIKKLDLSNNQFEVGDFSLENARILANLYLPTSTTKKETEKDSSKPLAFILNQGILKDVEVVYHNTAIAPTKNGLDFNHLNFSKLNLDLRKFKMINGQFAGSVKSAEVKENRGLNIQKMNADFVYEEKQAYLKNLYLQTPKTLLRDEVVLQYHSINQLTSNPGNVRVSANLRNSKIGFSDILNIVPSLRSTIPFNQYPNAILNVNSRVKGTVNDLHIQNFEISGIDQTKIAASGKIKNAMDPSKLFYDLSIREFSSSAKTVQSILPKNTLPSNITLPSFFTIKGNAKGTTEVVNTNLALTSTLGNLGLNAQLDLRRKNQEIYNVNANLKGLQIGKLIGMRELGSATGLVKVKGLGFNPQTMNTALVGNIQSLDYNGYRYQNVEVDGKINKGSYKVILDSKDQNARLNLMASGVYNATQPTVKLNGNVYKLDLNKLGFYQDPMIIAGDIDGSFENLNPDNLNGYLNLQNFALSDTKEIFPIQEMSLKAVSNEVGNELILNSQIADIDLKGKYKLTQIFGSFLSTINSYYQFQSPSKNTKIDPGQFFTLEAKIKDDDLIRKFVPELTSFETIKLNGNFDADNKIIDFKGEIPQLTYGANKINDGKMALSNTSGKLDFALNVANVNSESFALKKVAIDGDIADNSINYRASNKDEKDVTQFLIAGQVKTIDDLTNIHLNTDGLKLNYTDWMVEENNLIQIGKKGILADNFRISNNGSEISVQSERLVPNSPFNISIKDFKIETITEIFKKDSLLAKGTINGNAQISDLQNKMSFTSDLSISDLFVYGSPIGDINALVKNVSADVINAEVQLTGNNNDLKLLGDYNTKQSSFDMNLDIDRIEMKSIQGFSMNAINNAQGFLSGDLKIKGTIDAPEIRGEVKFNEVGLMIPQIGSNFKNINDAITFNDKGINFNRFRINDDDGNSMLLNGNILTKTYQDFDFDLNVNARDFKLIDSKKNNDAITYGVLAVNARLDIRGDLDLPVVDGTIAVTDETDFTFVLPQSSPSLQEREGIVEFIDQDKISLQDTLIENELNANSDIKGLDVNVNIELTKEAKISIIIDKANGDFVKLQGEAQLTGGIDPSGKTTLVGVYEVDQGAYELSVSMLKRKFDIQKGSTITWTGEPTTALLNLTAVYKTDAAPIDLVQQQIADLSSGELNMYKQRIPFNTKLILKGELLKPEISFDIDVNEDNPSVASSVIDLTKTRLEQLRNEESEMNKQVFALLLLNRFIGDNPFQSQAGLSAGTMARQSVSSILSQQLNNLASDLIKGVDINFGIDASEDYSSGTRNNRTDVNVDISKRLLNDRLKVSVGSNFGVEGDARQNEQMTNIAGDVNIDYNLSKDGRYMLRAYRKNEYQVALQGQIIETGLGFIITLDYNQFKEIFEKRQRNRAIRRTNQPQIRK